MAQEGFVLLGAGGDTSSRTLTNTLYHILANRQSVLIPLMEELRPLFPSAIARPPLRDLEQLPFLVSGYEAFFTRSINTKTSVDSCH